MDMNFIELMLLQYIGYFINGLGIYYTMHLLWKRKMCFKKHLLSYVVFYILFSTIIALISIPYIKSGSNITIELLFDFLKFSALILYYMYLFKSSNVKKIFPSIMICTALENIFSVWILSGMTKYLNFSSYPLFYLFHITSVCLVIIVLLHIISKTKIINYFRELLDVGFITIPITILYLISVYSMTYYIRISGIEIYKTTSAIVYIISVVVLGFLSIDFYNKKQLIQSKALLLQQHLYVNRLESVQQELRMIQHDYKNMIAAMYAQVDAGNTEAIKDYIRTKLLNIDVQVQEDIHQINQISQITNMELKGLLLVKILEAKNVNINIDLEVLYRVDQIAMDIKDLVCCIGILIDNAIEEAKNTPNKNITIIILQEDNKTTFVVKNDIVKPINISRIWENGYSTKGENHGLGLYNYKKIISCYENVFIETKIENYQFIQILIIT